MVTDFRDFLTAFSEAKVKFLVVGAHALAAHGVPRVTGDLDVWIEQSAENAQCVWAALTAFGAPLDTLGIGVADFTAADRVVQLGLPPYRLDIMTSVSGISFGEVWEHRISGTLFGVPVFFLGRDALIRNKRASGREKDMRDVRALGA